MRTHARAQGLRAAAARAAMPVAVALVLASAVTAGLVLHLPLPPSRRIATRIVTAQISRAMRGSIEIERISALSLRGVVARNVAILDPQGNVVLAAPEVHARGDLFAALLSGLPWSDHARLHITWVRAEHVDVKFRQDDTGTLTLATAFWAPPKPPSVPRVKLAVSRRPVTIDLSAIEVGTVAVRGRIGGYDGVHWDARGLLGSVHAGPDGSVVDVRPFPVMVREVTPRPVRAVVDYHFRSPELMWTSFVASMDDITVSGRAKLDGGYLDAVVDLPRTPPLAFALLLPETVRPTDPIEGRLAVRGTLPLLDTTAVVTSGDARVDAKGLLRLAPEIDADLALNVRQLDLSRVVVGGPATNLHADTVVRIGLDDAGAPTLRVTGRAQPTELLGVSLPESHIDAVVDRDGVRGKAMLQEPGMPVSADFSVSNNGRVDFVANANAPSLKHVPRLGGVVSGYAVTRVAGTYENGKLVGNAVADVGNVSAAGVRVGAGRVRARATASQRGVDVDASLSGSGLRAAGMTWGGVRATWRGSAQRAYMTLELTDDLAPRVSASARLHLGPRVAAHDVKVKLVQADREVLARTDIINLGGNTLDFGTLAVDGLGEPVNAVIRVGARGFDARVVSQGVDIDKLSRALGVALPAVDGQVAVDMDLRSIGAQTHGCVRLDVRGAKVPRPIWGIPVPDRVDASVRALFAGSTVDMDVNVSVGGERPAQQVQDRSIGACLPAEGVRGGGLFEARLAANATLHG
ncbi:MAG: hypothetical protein MUF54_25000, partial [Polyangiaceae bacterium]|nr:hypothetical protein [Polyangiaceae bacterium]